MGKIRVRDLARMIGMADQDLMFKLRSIGVRVEGEDAQVDTEVLKAVLEGKRLATPREVIVRDEESPASAGRAGAPPARRLPPEPPRPRPRNVIHKVEPRIPTLPVREREPGRPEPPRAGEAESPATAPAERAPVATAPSAPFDVPLEPETVREAPRAAAAAPSAPAPPAAAPAAARPAAPRPMAPRAAAPSARPLGPLPPRPPAPTRPPAGGPPRPAASPRPLSTPGRPAAMRPAAGPSARPAPSRPGLPPTRPGLTPPPPFEVRRRDDAKRPGAAKDKAKAKRPAAGGAADADLRQLRGRVDIEQLEDGPIGARRNRRLQRRDAADGTTAGERAAAGSQGSVTLVEGMTVRELAEKLGIMAKELIKMLFERGMLASINHVLEPQLAEELARELGFEALHVSFEEEVQLRQDETGEKREGKELRAPVVTIMGHVDHGKTTLLDAIRESRLVDAEHGGITQHIGAYEVRKGGRKLVFLDTPGHEAFTQLRARGGRAADIVVLVVAADDGVMPQTLEAIDHARAAKVPIVVAVNKVDKSNANQDRVKKELSEHGLMPEEWGGETVTVPISALKKEGISELLEMVLLNADLLDLKANPELPAQGVVLEARKETGRGVVATVLVQDGTLSVGDVFVTGATWGRVRSMVNDLGERLETAPPATPVEVTGFQELPGAGDALQVVQDEQKARGIAEFRQQEQRRRELGGSSSKISLEQLFDKIQQGEVKELPVVLKTDVQGSAEVLSDALTKLTTPKVKVNVLHTGVGAISTNDVLLASASRAIIIGFNVRPERNASELAEKEGVEIRLHTIIYELLDELRNAMAGLLEPIVQEVTKGRAEVRETFKIPKIGTIAGCHVVEGVVPRNAGVRLLRDNVVVYEGKISSLRRFKDDASEVRTGFDCGIGLERFQDVKPGDLIEAFVREEVRPTL